jgi:hypothetical protein
MVEPDSGAAESHAPGSTFVPEGGFETRSLPERLSILATFGDLTFPLPGIAAGRMLPGSPHLETVQGRNPLPRAEKFTH